METFSQTWFARFLGACPHQCASRLLHVGAAAMPIDSGGAEFKDVRRHGTDHTLWPRRQRCRRTRQFMERAGGMKGLSKGKLSIVFIPGKDDQKKKKAYYEFWMIYINVLLQEPQNQVAVPSSSLSVASSALAHCPCS